jgi:hypothetical protein
LYENCGNEFGQGKTNLALVEFYVEEIYGTRISVALKQDEIKDMLLTAVESFKNLKMESLEARSLRLQAVFEFKITNAYLRAKDKIEKAKAIAERINDR